MGRGQGGAQVFVLRVDVTAEGYVWETRHHSGTVRSELMDW